MAKMFLMGLLPLIFLAACSNTVPEIGFLSKTPRAALQFANSIKFNNQIFLNTASTSVSIASDYLYTEFAVGEGDSCEGLSWNSKASSYPLQLSSGDGAKLISYRFKVNETVFDCYTETVTLDTKIPSAVSLSVAADYEFESTKYIGSSKAADLQLQATDVQEMKISIASDCSGGAWESYTSEVLDFSLSSGDGIKDLSVKFRNMFGVETACLSTQVILDTTSPETGALGVSLSASETTERSSSPTASVSGEAADAGVGFDKFELSLGTASGQADVKAWQEMTSVSGGISGLDLGAGTYYLNIRARDKLMNYSGAKSASFVVRPAAPTLLLTSPASSPSNDPNPVLSISGLRDGNRVNLFSDSNCSSLVTSSTSVGGGVLNLTTGTLVVDGNYSVFAQIEENGLLSSCSSGITYVFDKTPPQIEITGLTPTSGTSEQTFTWTVSYDGADQVTLTSADVSLTGLATTGCQINVTGSGILSRTVTVSGCTGYGEIGISIAAGSAKDSVGNMAVAANSTEKASLLNRILVDFVKASDEVSEGTTTSTQTFALRASAASSEDIIVQYVLPDIYTSALNPSQHNLQNGSVVIPAGQTSAEISYSYYGSAVSRGSASIQVAITSLAGGNSFLAQNQVYRRLIKGEDQSAKVSSISLSYTQFCLTLLDGRLKCWGNNGEGQAGLGSVTVALTPQLVDSGAVYTQVSAGYIHTCGILQGGDLRCWGDNYSGQLGNNTTVSSTIPVSAGGSLKYKSISTGKYGTCGLTTDSELYCWGNNNAGQMGVGETGNAYVYPRRVDSGTTYSKVVRGGDHACGITTDGVLKCWGQNSYGQVGNNTTTNQSLPVVIDAGVAYFDVAAGDAATCAVTIDGVLKCWGHASLFSSSTSLHKLTPTIFDSGVQYDSVSVGVNHVCGVTKLNQVKCFGKNPFGQLGDGTQVNKYTPTLIESGDAYIAVKASWHRTCAVTTANLLRCWGWGNYGLGDGGQAKQPTPVEVDKSVKYEVVRNGQYFGCGLTESGTLRCWGMNDYGQIGDGSTRSRSMPMSIDPEERYTDLNAGYAHACAITINRGLKCWGANDNGQIGLGYSGVIADRPLSVDASVEYQKVAAGFGHTCAITQDNKLKCWGSNSNGQIGDGTFNDASLPKVIDAGVAYQDVTLGAFFTCGLTTHGKIKCWGYNYFGQLGDGTTVDHSLPVEIDSTTNYKALAAGWEAICGITTDGVLKCWGSNYSGQLGDGSFLEKLQPTVIDSGTLYKKVSMESEHACAITSSDEVKCWGSNTYWQIGIGYNFNAVGVPTKIQSTMSFSDIGVGGQHSCAVSTKKSLLCWGDNSYLQIGTGMANSLYPISIVP